jgi:hypothetical protein
MNEYQVLHETNNIRSAALYEWRKLPPKTSASCGVYYTELAEKTEQGLFATHNCVDPSGGNDHCVTLRQINPGDLIDHVTKPCMILYLTSRPAFVGSKIGGGRAYEEERLL